jgi:hypothetical protein
MTHTAARGVTSDYGAPQPRSQESDAASAYPRNVCPISRRSTTLDASAMYAGPGASRRRRRLFASARPMARAVPGRRPRPRVPLPATRARMLTPNDGNEVVATRTSRHLDRGRVALTSARGLQLLVWLAGGVRRRTRSRALVVLGHRFEARRDQRRRATAPTWPRPPAVMIVRPPNATMCQDRRPASLFGEVVMPSPTR